MPEPGDIPGDEFIWRRIDKGMVDTAPDGTETIQSWAYKDQEHEISVSVAKETTKEKLLASGKPEQIIIAVRAQAIRDLGFDIVRKPEPENPAHCLILPYPKKRSEFQALAHASAPVKE
jgi:hypothetical protein